MKQRNTSIELMRFLFSIMILVYHGYITLYSGSSPYLLFRQGAVGVEFFFILSGFLLAKHIYSLPDNGDSIRYGELGSETFAYIKKKYLSIFPFHAIVFFILFFERTFLEQSSITEAIRNFIYSIPELFLIQMSGLQLNRVNNNVWYVSALLFASLILYPLMRRYRELFSKVIGPILVLIILGKLYQETDGITPTPTWMGLFMKGTLRAIAEMSLGNMAYILYTYLCHLKLNFAGRLLLRFTEFCCYITVFVLSCAHEHKRWVFVFLFILALGITLTFTPYSMFKKISRNKVILYLGKLSLGIFLCQWIPLYLVERYMIGISYWKMQLVYCVSTIILAALLQGIINLFRKRFCNMGNLFLVRTN